jgi:hemerythrin-like domain-containing protein
MSTEARNRQLEGTVDFTMMYAAHDAFARDLRRLAEACRGDRLSAKAVADWSMFERQLHVHHTSEDEALWPPLRAAIAAAGTVDELAVLDAMEREHAVIEPSLERVGELLQAADVDAIGREIALLTADLRGHMAHEERSALPLVEAHLGAKGWAEFGAHIRATQGLRAAATFLPWLLDEAAPDVRRRVLRILPPPARLLYATVWEPRYRRARANAG